MLPICKLNIFNLSSGKAKLVNAFKVHKYEFLFDSSVHKYDLGCVPEEKGGKAGVVLVRKQCYQQDNTNATVFQKTFL